MNEEISTGLMLMGVGMITVFVVLTLVVVVGTILIKFVNRFLPEEIKEKARQVSTAINQDKLAAITAAVEIFTKGKGRITGIKKI